MRGRGWKASMPSAVRCLTHPRKCRWPQAASKRRWHGSLRLQSRPRRGNRPGDSVFPQPLFEAAGGDLDRVRWRGIGMGSSQCILSDDGQASVRLLSIPPKAKLPEHTHEGMELTLVLRGAFEDRGQVYRRGDVALADDDIEHAPEVIGEDVCICLAASDNRLRFQTWLPRLAQPFLRI